MMCRTRSCTREREEIRWLHRRENISRKVMGEWMPDHGMERESEKRENVLKVSMIFRLWGARRAGRPSACLFSHAADGRPRRQVSFFLFQFKHLIFLSTRPRADSTRQHKENEEKKSALHDHAPAAALLLVAAVFYAHFRDAVLLAARLCARVRGHFLVISADLAHNIVEGVVDVDAALGGCLDEFAAELPCEVLALCGEVSTTYVRAVTGARRWSELASDGSLRTLC